MPNRSETDEESGRRREAEASARQFRTLLEAVPGCLLILTAKDYRIVAATDAYLEATMTRRDDIVGRHVFDVFPDDSSEADGMFNLHRSLERVRREGVVDAMPVQRYPIPRPGSLGGGFEERYWSPVNSPVPGEDGEVAFIIHRVQDVSEQTLAADRLADANRLLRFAGRAARLGAWRVDLEDRRVEWGPETAAIHEEPVDFSPDFESAIGYYAPEHQQTVRAAFERCASHGEPFDEVLQLVTARNNRVWVRAIGEPERDQGGRIVAVRGAFQDVSDLIAVQQTSENLSRRLQETLESITDAFFTLDEQWNFTFLNSQAERLLERSRGDLLGRSVWEAFPEAVGSRFQQSYERVMANRVTERFVEYFEPLASWFEVNAYPTDSGLAVYFRNVTEERKRNEHLRLLEAAVSRQNDVLLITEARPIDAPAGPRTVYVNDAFVRRTGYTREEAIGRTPRILQGPDTSRAELARIRRALETWQPVRAELLNYTKAGEEIWLELDIVPLADAAGHYTHWVSIERDVTERRRTDEALRVSNERFELVARATNDTIWDWDLAHGTVWWNEGLRDHFGYPPESVEPGPESWMKRIHPDDRDRVLEGIDAAIEGDASNWLGEYRFMHADGRALTVVDRGFVIRNEAGEAIRMLGSMVDVSEHREQEERLRQAQKLEAVGQLTGGVAHDFNNLLTVILGNAELLSESLTDQQQLRLLAEMTATAAERGAELTNRLLAFARRQALQPQRLDINKLIAGMDGLLRRTVTEDIEIEMVRAAGLWHTEVDSGQLEVALLNLVINARDAMPNGGRLTIETANARFDEAYAAVHDEAAAGQYVMVSVSDTGHGMPPDVVARAFEPFFTTKEVGKGSGLGLSMVYGFVKQSGGHANVYSELDEGTTVRLYFPRAAQAHGPEVSLPGASPAAEGGSEYILVVEDDALVREHLLAQLKGLGYRVSGAASGREALEFLRQMSDVDLLFTDVVMPGGMNGRELADAARELRPELRVLFTSGYSENAIVHHGRLDAGVHLLSKPYRRQELAAKVRKVLDE